MRRSLIVVALLALATAACGGNGDGAAETESVSRAKATRYFNNIDRLLDRAVAAHRQGNTEEAAELAGQAYLENFEFVEHDLEERNAQLKEELEELMGPGFRQEIQRGMSQEALEARVAEAKRLLEQAKTALGVA
ncbi:MAG: hypothetical protein M3N24_11060 [Actinomycetota bacterium]|nr:hypothetical protein [Actinomycetota bacterium]